METILKAPYGKFRVVGLDTLDNRDWLEEDFDTVDEAIQRADDRGGEMIKMFVYDAIGNHLHEAGTY